MHFGFTIIRQTKGSENPVFPDQQAGLSYSDHLGSEYYFSYHRNERFAQDKLFFENEQYIGGIDGVVLNLDKLKKSFAQNNWQSLFIQLYKKYGPDFVNQLYGEYAGFVFDKTQNKLIYFTNHCATKKVYYHHSEEFTIIAPSITTIARLLESKGHNNKLDITSAYALLTYGGNYGTSTLINGISRLHGGCFLTFKANNLQVEKYFDYNAITIKNDTEEAYIDQLEGQFQDALQLEYDKDAAYGKQHFATLSGGLDSRMNVMLADQLGFTTTNFCFSQSGYEDEQIARAIAKHLGQQLLFVPLDGGKYILDYDENLDLYEGQIFYTTSAHFNYAIKEIDLSTFGLIHTGLLGDGFLGTLISSPKPSPPNLTSKLISNKLLPMIQKEMEELGRHYSSDDVFQIHQRCFNIAVSGCWAMEQYSYLVSPFMYPEFIKTCLSMPVKYKYRQRIYLKWINKHHKSFTKFKWEATGMRPLYTWQKTLSRFTKKANAIGNRLRGKPGLSMTPYFYWYDNVPEIKSLVHRVFDQKITYLNGDPTLKKNVTELFHQGNIVEKILVMTLLGAIEKLNISV